MTQTITLPWAHPGAIAVGAGRVWVADPAARQLAEIDPATGSLQRTLPVGLQPSAIVTAGQAIWVAGYDTATVEKLAPASGRVLARVRVGADPAALAVGDGSLWVASSADATVSRIDLATSAVTATIRSAAARPRWWPARDRFGWPTRTPAPSPGSTREPIGSRPASASWAPPPSSPSPAAACGREHGESP